MAKHDLLIITDEQNMQLGREDRFFLLLLLLLLVLLGLLRKLQFLFDSPHMTFHIVVGVSVSVPVCAHVHMSTL